MGANEQLALDSKFSRWKESRAAGLPSQINPFEYFCLEHYLRDWVDSDEEIQTGLIGGSQDGGVDAVYFFVNRELVTENSDPPDPENVIKTTILIFQVKEGEGFSPVAIDKLYNFIEDLLELTRPESSYHTKYRPELLKLMRLYKETYKSIIGAGVPASEVRFFYITKKDAEPNDDCASSETKVKAKVKALCSKAEYAFNYVNATRLWNFVDSRPENKALLTWAAQPLDTPEGPVGLVTLPDYYKFLKDKSNNELNKRIFESNVRGFWPTSPINKEIQKTLESSNGAEFWLLNNGITILAGGTGTAGHLQIEIQDPQIVNGLQTSRLIYNYYDKGAGIPNPDTRRILVRVIKLQEGTARDAVIRATNSQNKMPPEALRATDPIHRQIEELFQQSGLFYDRRKGHYKELGKPVGSIVSIVDVLQALLSCLIGRPDRARGRPRNYFTADKKYPYEDIFGEGKYNLNVYLKSVQILRRVDKYLETLEPIHRRNLRFYVGMYAACTKAQQARVVPAELLKIDLATLTDTFLRQCTKRVRRSYDRLAEKTKSGDEYDYDVVAKGSKLIKSLASSLNKKYANGPRLSIDDD